MRRTLLLLAVAAATMGAVSVQAREMTPRYSAPSWRYQWFEGRWWYWLPQEKWVYWNGAGWRPFESSGQVHTSYYGNYDAETPPVAAQATSVQPTGSTGENCPPSYNGSTYSAPFTAALSGSGAAGYGWSWGAGTAFRNSPGGRF